MALSTFTISYLKQKATYITFGISSQMASSRRLLVNPVPFSSLVTKKLILSFPQLLDTPGFTHAHVRQAYISGGRLCIFT